MKTLLAVGSSSCARLSDEEDSLMTITLLELKGSSRLEPAVARVRSSKRQASAALGISPWSGVAETLLEESQEERESTVITSVFLVALSTSFPLFFFFFLLWLCFFPDDEEKTMVNYAHSYKWPSESNSFMQGKKS